MKLKTSDGFSLDAVFNRVEKSKWVIILSHGVTSNKVEEVVLSALEKKLNEGGFSTLRFDYRAHGKSSGNSIEDFSISGELIDLETIIFFLKKEGFEKIGLVGVSFGGGVGAEFAGRHPDVINKLCLVSPVIDSSLVMHGTSDWCKKYFSNYEAKLSSKGYIVAGSSGFKFGPKAIKEMLTYTPHISLTHYPGPVLLVHGTADEIVNLADVQKVLKTVSVPHLRVELIKDGDHAFHKQPYQKIAVEKILSFFTV